MKISDFVELIEESLSNELGKDAVKHDLDFMRVFQVLKQWPMFSKPLHRQLYILMRPHKTAYTQLLKLPAKVVLDSYRNGEYFGANPEHDFYHTCLQMLVTAIIAQREDVLDYLSFHPLVFPPIVDTIEHRYDTKTDVEIPFKANEHLIKNMLTYPRRVTFVYQGHFMTLEHLADEWLLQQAA